MKKLLCLLLSCAFAICCFSFTGCSKKEKITIFTSTEDYTMDYMTECFDEVFPDYEIVIEYMSTSDIAAKITAEGSDSSCDIIFAEEYGYIEKMVEKDVLADISKNYDYSVYTDDTLTTTAKNYLLPSIKTGGAVIINNDVLTDRGLPKPTSYESLLDAKYKGLVSMPSPKSSGTGYMFYYSLIKAMGEENALNYFDGLSENILAFTTSGSGPVNALTMQEVAVGFGMISQAVEKINEGNTALEVIFFEEGAPCNYYGNCVVKGKETRECVMEVMDYLYETFTDNCCERFYPESILKNKTYQKENFPSNIKYADMDGNTLDRKTELLEKWNH